MLTPVGGLEQAQERLTADPWHLFAGWARTFLSVPFLVATAPLRVIRQFIEWMDEQTASGREGWDARRNAFYDRGGSDSVRQLVGESSDGVARYRVYLEYLDREMHLRVIERRLVEEFAIALDAFGVDTTAFRGRSSVIYNSGVMVSGATIKGENVAIGNQASITTQIKDAVSALAQRATSG